MMTIVDSLFLISQKANYPWMTSDNQNNIGYKNFYASEFFDILEESLGEKSVDIIYGNLNVVAKYYYCEELSPIIVPFDDTNKIQTNCKQEENCDTLFFVTDIWYDNSVITDLEIQSAKSETIGDLFADEFPYIDNPNFNIPELPPYCPHDRSQEIDQTNLSDIEVLV